MNYQHLIAGLLLLVTAASAQAQTCRNDITPSTPTNQFQVHNNGTVTHTATGLIWQRCSLGQIWDGTTCTGSAGDFFWQEALQAAEKNTFAGYADWRLPNIKELESLVEQACYNPAINTDIFPSTPARSFWPSSPIANNTNTIFAWYVNFNDGQVASGIYNHLSVRLVRDLAPAAVNIMKVSWFINGQNKKIIPEGFSGRVKSLFTWWGDHSVKLDIDNDGNYDFDFDEDYPSQDVANTDVNLTFDNGFSLLDYEQWTGYWYDEIHGRIDCWESNCSDNPYGVGAVIELDDSGFSCDKNIWKYNGSPVGEEIIYCRNFPLTNNK